MVSLSDPIKKRPSKRRTYATLRDLPGVPYMHEEELERTFRQPLSIDSVGKGVGKTALSNGLVNKGAAETQPTEATESIK